MKTSFYSWSTFLGRRHRYFLLVVLSVTGSFLGILCAYHSRYDTASLMHSCISASVSIVRLSFALLLPFFAAILAALYSKHSALLLICFVKIFCFSFCLMGVRLSCGSAGWLICGLLMLSDAVSVLLLFRLTLRHLNVFLPSFGADVFGSIFLILGISVLDCICFAPFLVRIIKN